MKERNPEDLRWYDFVPLYGAMEVVSRISFARKIAYEKLFSGQSVRKFPIEIGLDVKTALGLGVYHFTSTFGSAVGLALLVEKFSQ